MLQVNIFYRNVHKWVFEFGGQKISTSKIGQYGYADLKDFPDQQDVLRYVLTANRQRQKITILHGKNFNQKTITNLLQFMVIY